MSLLVWARFRLFDSFQNVCFYLIEIELNKAISQSDNEFKLDALSPLKVEISFKIISFLESIYRFLLISMIVKQVIKKGLILIFYCSTFFTWNSISNTKK
jgi:hypothetical protein